MAEAKYVANGIKKLHMLEKSNCILTKIALMKMKSETRIVCIN